MPLFNNTYSGLITKGLGLPACCGLITMGFGLFKCTIEITEPPEPPITGGGGGGGIAVQPGVTVQWPKMVHPKTKTVNVTVRYGEKHTWKKSYTVSGRRATIAVKAVNIANKTANKLLVGVESIRRVARSATAVFRDTDK